MRFRQRPHSSNNMPTRFLKWSCKQCLDVWSFRRLYIQRGRPYHRINIYHSPFFVFEQVSGFGASFSVWLFLHSQFARVRGLWYMKQTSSRLFHLWYFPARCKWTTVSICVFRRNGFIDHDRDLAMHCTWVFQACLGHCVNVEICFSWHLSCHSRVIYRSLASAFCRSYAEASSWF